jgi:hypothetical protein
MDKGGAPRMMAFRALVTGLMSAFRIATGREAKVTWNDHRDAYEGRFLAFVEVVLELVLRMKIIEEKPLRYPLARGKYIYELTRAGAAKEKHAPMNV